jgi:plastocyanin
MRRFPLILVLCLVAALGVVACGGDDDGGGDTAATDTTTTETTDTTEGGGGGKTVKVAADPGGDLKFVQESLTAPVGKSTFEFTNESSIPHDFAVEEDGNDVGKTDVISGDTATVELDLQAGEYTFYCSVPGHRQAGMQGTLTVE